MPFSSSRSQAAALKGTAVTTLSERVLIRGQKVRDQNKCLAHQLGHRSS
jgi:hypothetical protein